MSRDDPRILSPEQVRALVESGIKAPMAEHVAYLGAHIDALAARVAEADKMLRNAESVRRSTYKRAQSAEARVAELEQRLASEGLPSDLLAALRDPGIVLSRDAELWPLLEKWRSAPSNTASAEFVAMGGDERLFPNRVSALEDANLRLDDLGEKQRRRAERAEALLRQAAEALDRISEFTCMGTKGPVGGCWSSSRDEWCAACIAEDFLRNPDIRSLIDKESHV